MTEGELQKYEGGYKEGFFFAAQAVASAMLRLMENHPSLMLEPARREAQACIKLETERILRKRGCIPSAYRVIGGEAEDVPVDFDLLY